MEPKSIFLRGQHAVQLVLCFYGAVVSYKAIVRLQKYEKTSEKLAGWSKEAARQLKLTRTTQASGALSILASTVASMTLTLYYTSLPKWTRISISPILLLAVIAARTHMKNYWAPKDGKTVGMNVPLPNMKEYNEAQLQTQDLLKVLEYLEYSWVAASFLNALVP